MKNFVFTGIVLFLTMFFSYGQTAKEKGLSTINEEVVKGQLEFLASDWTEGRETGAKGCYMAADYIASMFRIYGIKPFGDQIVEMPSRRMMMRPGSGFRPKIDTSYFQNFGLVKYTPGDDMGLSVISTDNGGEYATHYNYQTDFTLRSGTQAISAKAPVVFAGYGLTDEDNKYDDFKNLDVKGKIVVTISGYPGHKDTTSAAYDKFKPKRQNGPFRMMPPRGGRGGNQYEALIEGGAIALIQVSYGEPPKSWATNNPYPAKGKYYEADEPLASYYDYSMSLPGVKSRYGGSSLPVLSITKTVFDKLIEGTDLNVDEFEEYVKDNMKPASKALTGKSIAFQTSVNSEIIKVRNVVGYIEGENKDDYIVVGGHYDHLGKFDGWIWNGADDNASGTVGVMTIAKAFAESGKKPQKSIIFSAWTAEEKGLYGSTYFVKKAKEKGMNIVLNLNYDMIARDTDEDTEKNMASMSYTAAYKGIREITEKNVEKYNINLDLEYEASVRPGGGSDHAPFAAEDIPIFYFMAAMHEDYHQPSDELSKVNWTKMTNIIRIGYLDIWEFANNDDYLIKSDVVEEENDRRPPF